MVCCHGVDYVWWVDVVMQFSILSERDVVWGEVSSSAVIMSVRFPYISLTPCCLQNKRLISVGNTYFLYINRLYRNYTNALFGLLLLSFACPGASSMCICVCVYIIILLDDRQRGRIFYDMQKKKKVFPNSLVRNITCGGWLLSAFAFLSHTKLQPWCRW